MPSTARTIVIEAAAGALVEAVFDGIIGDATSNAIEQLNDFVVGVEIRTTFGERLAALDDRSGLLFGVFDYTDASDGRFTYGPYYFGTGSKPHQPLVDLMISRGRLRDFDRGIQRALARPGLQPAGNRYYWVVRRPEGGVTIHAHDSKLTDTAMRERVALVIGAAQRVHSSRLDKMRAQAEHLVELEDTMREAARRRGLEAMLADLRDQFQDATADFAKAKAARDEAVRAAQGASALDFIAQMVSIAKLGVELHAAASAQAQYNHRAMQNTVTQYNQSIEHYIFIMNNQLGVDGSVLPADPTIELPGELPSLELY